MPSVASEPSRPLFFLHVRKTAGLSARNWLVNRFPVDATLLDCHHVAHQHLDPSAYRFVTGHVGFDFVARFRTRPVCFVVLREPVERALSAFYFFQRNDDAFLRWLEETLPPHLAEERVRFTRRANELTLVEFLEEESALARGWLGDVQTRCLLGRPEATRPGPELLAEATANLESCEVVGLTEHLDTSLARVAEFMGWPGDDGSVPHDNPTRGRPRVADIPARARDLLTGWNQLDLQLYHAAQRRFREWRPRSRPAPQALPAGADFTFDQPIHGGGWYARERGERGWFCWTGAEAWLDLKPAGAGECVLEVRVAHVMHPRALEGLEVRVNGRPVAVQFRSEENAPVVVAAVPAAAVAGNPDRVRVSFAVREAVRVRDLVPDSPDPRTLGVALDRVRLVPAARAAA